MNQSEAQRIVKQTYPKAWYDQFDKKIYANNYVANNFGGVLGNGDTREVAWIDAASKLNRTKR